MADNGPDKPKPNVDDISLDDARPPRKGGGAGAVLILVLLIAIAVGIWYAASVQKQRKAEAAKQAKIADDARQAQLAKVNENLQAAVNANAAGDLAMTIKHLQEADALLGNIVSAANSEGNTKAAEEVLKKKGAVSDALSALQTALSDHLTIISTQFGLSAPAAPIAPATGTTPPTGTETPPPAVQPGAGATPTTPPAAEPPAAPGMTPPVSGGPAAPVQPTPVAPVAPTS